LDVFKLSYGPLSRFIIILFVGVLLLNLMAVPLGMRFSYRKTDSETPLFQRLAQIRLAMAYSVTVSAAKLFMQTWYAKLFEQPALSAAIRFARLALHNDKTRKAVFNQQIDL